MRLNIVNAGNGCFFIGPPVGHREATVEADRPPGFTRMELVATTCFSTCCVILDNSLIALIS